MPKHYTILESHNGAGFNSDNRYWKVEIAGQVYFASVERGRSVRIAFKPRGENRGFKWHSSVRDAAGKSLDSPREVTKGTGLAYLLEYAGLIPLRPSELAKVHSKALWEDHFRAQELRETTFGNCPCALCNSGV